METHAGASKTLWCGHLLVDVSSCRSPAHNGVGGRFSVDVGLRVDGEDSSSVHFLQLVLQQIGFLGQRLIVPRQTQHLDNRDKVTHQSWRTEEYARQHRAEVM